MVNSFTYTSTYIHLHLDSHLHIRPAQPKGCDTLGYGSMNSSLVILLEGRALHKAAVLPQVGRSC